MRPAIADRNRRAQASGPPLLAIAAFSALAASVGSTGCPSHHARVQGIRIECSEPTARIFVDGRFAGLQRKWKGRILRLKAGRHLVEIRKRGYFTRFRQVRVKPGRVQELKVILRRELE